MDSSTTPGSDQQTDPVWLFTENETNVEKLFESANSSPFVKDAFHRFVIEGNNA